MQFYKGRNNVQCLQVSKRDCDTGTSVVDLSPVTKVEVFFLGAVYSSEDYPEAFDWGIDPANGRLNLALGVIPSIPIGNDSKSELSIFDPSKPLGVMLGLVNVRMAGIA